MLPSVRIAKTALLLFALLHISFHERTAPPLPAPHPSAVHARRLSVGKKSITLPVNVLDVFGNRVNPVGEVAESCDTDGESSVGVSIEDGADDITYEHATGESDAEGGSSASQADEDDDGPVMIVADDGDEPEECGYSFNHSLRKKRARAFNRMSSGQQREREERCVQYGGASQCGSYGSINDPQTVHSDYKEMGYVPGGAAIPDPMQNTRCGKVCFVLLICAIIAS